MVAKENPESEDLQRGTSKHNDPGTGETFRGYMPAMFLPHAPYWVSDKLSAFRSGDKNHFMSSAKA